MGGITNMLFGSGNNDADKALALQQQQLAEQKKAEEAKEAKMQRERMSDMRARVSGGFGDAGGNNDATG